MNCLPQTPDHASDDGNMRQIAAVRQMVVAYWKDEGDEYQSHRAIVLPLDEVVAKLLSDIKAFEAMYLAAEKQNEPLHVEIARLRSEVADMRRPMTEQMEMQNRTIIALNGEIDRLRSASSATQEPTP